MFFRFLESHLGIRDYLISNLLKCLFSAADRLPLRQLIACLAKAVIPSPDKLANKVTEIDVWKRPRVGDVGPGVHPGPAVGKSFKRYPLLHGIAEHVVNPGNLPWRRTNRNHMIDSGFLRTDDFDFKSASWLPGLPLAPANVSIDIGKSWPKAIVAKYLPCQGWACLGKGGVLQILHLLLLPRRD